MAILTKTLNDNIVTNDSNQNIQHDTQINKEYYTRELLAVQENLSKNISKTLFDNVIVNDLANDYGGEMFSNYTILDNAKTIPEMLTYFDRPDAYYTKFATFSTSTINSNEFIVKAELHGFQHLIFPSLRSFNVTELVPFKVDTGNLSVPSTGSSVTFNASFDTPPAVTSILTGNTDSTLYQIYITQITTTGFSIKIARINNSATTIEGSVEWVATGY